MRVLTNEDDYDLDDSAQCPFCRKWIGGLADDVFDDDWNGKDRDVAAGECPACGQRIAIVRLHEYRLAKFAPAAKEQP